MKRGTLLSVSLVFLSLLLLCSSIVNAQDPWVRVIADGDCRSCGYHIRDSGWRDGNPASASALVQCGPSSLPHKVDYGYIWAWRWWIFKIVRLNWYLYVRYPARWSRVRWWWSGSGDVESVNITLPYRIGMNQTLASSAFFEIVVIDVTTGETLYYSNASVREQEFHVYGPLENEAWEQTPIIDPETKVQIGLEASIEPINITIPVTAGHEIEGNITARVEAEEENAIASTIAGPRPEPVGGFWVPVDKFGLLAPYIGLTSTVVVAIAASAIYVKRAKRRKDRR